MRKRTKWFFL